MPTLSMPLLKRDEDYFKDSTMTFGEHLDELRTCLLKAMAGLFVGVALGMFVGTYVVGLISAPLENALGGYYQSQAVTAYKDWAAAQTALDRPLPYTTEQIQNLVDGRGLIYEMRNLDLAQASVAMRAADPKLGKGLPAAHAEKADVDPESFATLFLWHPIASDARISPKVLNFQEGFMIWFKASFVVGIVLSSPWVFYQIWSFVAAGLYPHEKKYIHVFLPFSLGLFLAGAALAYLFVFQPVLAFLLNINGTLGFDTEPRITEWLGFVIFLPLGFGVSFQLPLVMLFLERIGVFTAEAYVARWRIAILVIVILSAVLTPADPYSIFLMAVPLVLLYFGGVLLCRWLPRSGASPRFEA